MRAAACFDVDDFQRLVEGKLAAGEVEEISDHLEICERCTRLVQEMPENDLVGVIRASRRMPGPSGDDRGIKELIERVLELRSRGWTADGAPDTQCTEPTASQALATPLPASIGRYRVLSRLGAGGMGTVYLADDPDLSRHVAIKVPQFSGSRDNQDYLRQRFLREPPRPRWLLATAALGLAVAGILAVAIIVHIKHPDGTQTDVVAPAGSRVEIDDKGNATVILPGDKKDGADKNSQQSREAKDKVAKEAEAQA
jgi:anti-sigma factor RsiW